MVSYLSRLPELGRVTRVIRYRGRLRPAESSVLSRRLFWNQWFHGWMTDSGLVIVTAAGVLLLFAPLFVADLARFLPAHPELTLG
jgi:hypothetical protein